MRCEDIIQTYLIERMLHITCPVFVSCIVTARRPLVYLKILSIWVHSPGLLQFSTAFGRLCPIQYHHSRQRSAYIFRHLSKTEALYFVGGYTCTPVLLASPDLCAISYNTSYSAAIQLVTVENGNPPADLHLLIKSPNALFAESASKE